MLIGNSFGKFSSEKKQKNYCLLLTERDNIVNDKLIKKKKSSQDANKILGWTECTSSHVNNSDLYTPLVCPETILLTAHDWVL